MNVPGIGGKMSSRDPEEDAVPYEYPGDRKPAVDPFPDRVDPNEARIRQAKLAREVARSQILAGTDTSSRSRSFIDPSKYDRVVSRDPDGRLRIDWSRVDPDNE